MPRDQHGGHSPQACRLTATANTPGSAVQLAREYVRANYARPFSLDEIARATGVTKWHLSRLFRQRLGMTIGGYTRLVRAQQTLELLKQRVPLSVAAAAVGYSDQPHMTRELRAFFGFTPGEYVRRLSGG